MNGQNQKASRYRDAFFLGFANEYGPS
jgi:hypothetical protein